MTGTGVWLSSHLDGLSRETRSIVLSFIQAAEVTATAAAVSWSVWLSVRNGNVRDAVSSTYSCRESCRQSKFSVSVASAIQRTVKFARLSFIPVSVDWARQSAVLKVTSRRRGSYWQLQVDQDDWQGQFR